MPNGLLVETHFPTARELLVELMPHTGGLWTNNGNEHGWLFRGSFEAAWSLQPSAMRADALSRYSPGQVVPPPRASWTAQERCGRELDMVLRFATNADDHGFHIPGDSPALRTSAGANSVYDFPSIDLRGMFALAQHHNVPTRLLDWSRSPLIGAYFACDLAAEYNLTYQHRRNLPTALSENCVVWVLSQASMVRHLQSSDPRVSLVTAPSAQILNLHAQRGQFTLVHYSTSQDAHVDDPPDLDTLVEGRPDPTEAALLQCGPILQKFTFPRSEAGRLLFLLSELNVTAGTVYPGLDSMELLMHERNLYITN